MGFVQSLSTTYEGLVAAGRLLGSNYLRPLYTNISQNLLGFDTRGRAKSYQDYSIFNALFNLEVPPEMWVEEIDGVYQISITHFTSINGMLKCQGIASQSNALHSKRHIRLNPGRGLIYYAAMILPDYALTVNQEFGLFTDYSGVFFRVNNSKIYAVRRNWKDGVTTDYPFEITKLPTDFDMSKLNSYDIQKTMDGDVKFYINNKLCYTMGLTGIADNITTFNSHLPTSFVVDGAAVMYCNGCDMSVEGGKKQNRQRGNATSGEVSLTTAETNVLLLHMPNTITYNTYTVVNAFDLALRRIFAYADENTLVRLYFSRDSSKFAGTIFGNVRANGSVEYSVGLGISVDNLTTNITKQLEVRVPSGGSVPITNPDAEVGDYYITHGDYVLITMQAKNNTNGGTTLEWGAEL